MSELDLSAYESELTYQELYNLPTKFKIDFYNADESSIISTYNAFQNMGNFTVIGINVEKGYFTPGAFSINIYDKDENLKSSGLKNGCIAKIYWGRTEELLSHLATGIINMKEDEVNRRILLSNYSGHGKGKILNDTQIDFKKLPIKINSNSLQPSSNQVYRIDDLIMDALQNPEYMIDNSNLPVIDRGNFDLSYIENNIPEQIYSIDYKGSVSGLLETFANATGRVLITDDNRIKLHSPNSQHSGIIIRQRNDEIITTHSAVSTCYVDEPQINYRTSILADDGFYNQIFLTISLQSLTAESGSSSSYVSLANKMIAQQFRPTSERISDMAFIMQKTGSGKSTIEDALDQTAVYGYIVTDSGSNTLSTNKVATFYIPLTSIPNEPRTVTDIRITYSGTGLDPNVLHWIVWEPIGISEDSTVYLFNDGDNTTPTSDDNIRRNAIRTASISKPIINNPNWNLGFVYNDNGPVFTYNFFTNAIVTLFGQDTESIKRYTPDRPSQLRISAPFVRDIKTGYKMIYSLLSYSAKEKLLLDDLQVTIPLQGIKPTDLIEIDLPVAKITPDMPYTHEVTDMTVSANARNLQNPLGVDSIKISVTSFANHHDSLYMDKGIGESICQCC